MAWERFYNPLEKSLHPNEDYLYSYTNIGLNNRQYKAVIGMTFTKMLFKNFCLLLACIGRIINKRLGDKLAPKYCSSANKFLFIDRKGRIVKDKEEIKKLYRTLLIGERFYLGLTPVDFNPILSSSEQFYKNYREFIKPKIKYNKTNIKEIEDVQEISKKLDFSDEEMLRASIDFFKRSNNFFNRQHDFSHKPDFDKIPSLEQEFLILKKFIEKNIQILKKREELWIEYDKSLRIYLEYKTKKFKLCGVLMKDFINLFINFPFGNSLLFLIKGISKEIYSSFFGHKSIEKIRKAYENKVTQFDKVYEYLFLSEIPYSKIII